MEKLEQQLQQLIKELDNSTTLLSQLDHLPSVFPFNKLEYTIALLLGNGKLSLEQYYQLREEYISRNRYLNIFEISAPRGFGENWAQNYLNELVPNLKKPAKKLDPNYSGQYDFWLDGITIEVKASRAVDFNSKEALYKKALPSGSNFPFDMNFQQIKPACCDVFVWIAVWRDLIRYWVLSSHEVETNSYFSTGQHRGNVGEGQLHVRHDNIHEFKKYECKPEELKEAIINAKSR